MSHDDHGSHHVNYLAVFFALCVFTGMSVAFDVFAFENRAITIVLVLAVAVAKAMCVMMFFMHLKFEGNWKFVLLAPTTILAIGLPLALMPDIGVAYYTTVAPQTEAWGEEMEAYRSTHHAEHGDADTHEHEDSAESSDQHSEQQGGEHADH
jgi:cytochrome c oxidase subunit 4